MRTYFNNKIKSFFSIKSLSRSASNGMTYVELIVVLFIFAVMSSIIFFNYGEFQAKVDIKNLAGDIALKVVEAQKQSLNGILPSLAQQSQIPSGWKPSYGVYFDITLPQQFIYFVDLDQSGTLFNPDCAITNSECLSKINIVQGNDSISSIDKCTDVDCNSSSPILNPFSIVFKRPDSAAIFTYNSTGASLSITDSNYIRITIKSPKTATAAIKIYPSGRVQVN